MVEGRSTTTYRYSPLLRMYNTRICKSKTENVIQQITGLIEMLYVIRL